MSDVQTNQPGHSPEDFVLPLSRQHGLGRLRYLSAAILLLPTMAGARTLPSLASQAHVFVSYPDYAPTQADTALTGSRYCTDTGTCRTLPVAAPVTEAAASVTLVPDAEPSHDTRAAAVKPRTAKAKRRRVAEQSTVFIAYTEDDASNASSAPDTIAARHPVAKAKRRQALAQPRGVVARRVTHAHMAPAEIDVATTEHPVTNKSVNQARVIAACPVVDLPDTSRVPEAVAVKHSPPKATRRSTKPKPHTAVAQRVVHSPKKSSAAAVKHSTPKAPTQPAAVQSDVTLAYHAAQAPEEYLHQQVAIVDPSSTTDRTIAAYQGQNGYAHRVSGGPSASDAFVAADPQQLMIPPSTPEPQAMTALHSYHYVPGQKTVDDVPRPPAQQELIQLNQDGDYAALAKKGDALLKKEKVDDPLKFLIANAMAWTGKLNSAETLYKTLLNGPMALDTKVALANIQRWRGKNYVAIPMYREVLAADPTHEEAAHGLQLSEEALRPRTQLAVNRTHDSDDVDTSLVTVNHQWQTHDGLRTWGVEVNRMSASSPITDAHQATIVVRHQALDIAMEPAVELAVGDRLYGRVTIRPTPLPIHVTVGQVNWGQMSLNPIALEKRLSAVDLGVNASFDGRFGNLSMAADNFHVSDSNNVQTGTLRFAPAIHLPLHIKPVVGVEYRKSDFNTTSYWSPDVGYGTGYVGLEGDWSGKNDRWTISASAQRGWGFYGEARPSWGGTLSGRYKITRDWTLGASAWSIINSRNDKPYQAHSGIIFLERAW